MNQYTSLADRFEAQHVKIPIAGCWIWTGDIRTSRLGDQRPKIKSGGKSVTAYRVAYELLMGAIPDGLWVLHRCDISLCVNPHHLFLGTAKDNNVDCARKGRNTAQINPEEARERGRALGVQNTWSKGRAAKSIIPHADIKAISRRMENGESPRMIALGYGVSREAVRKFMKRASERALLTAGVTP